MLEHDSIVDMHWSMPNKTGFQGALRDFLTLCSAQLIASFGIRVPGACHCMCQECNNFITPPAHKASSQSTSHRREVPFMYMSCTWRLSALQTAHGDAGRCSIILLQTCGGQGSV